MSINQITKALRNAVRDLAGHHLVVMAAGLAYYFVLSLFPLLIVLSTVLIYLPVPDLFGRLLAAMGSIVPSEGMSLVRVVMNDVLSRQHPKLLSAGIVGMLYGATGGFSSMIEALNVAYDTRETRPWWRTRLLSVSLTFVIGSLFVVALAVLMVGPEFGGWLAGKFHLAPEFVFAWNYLRWGIAVGFTVLAIELLYFWAPNVRNRFVSTLPGAALAVSAWLAASWALGLYIRQLGSFNKTYGTLGAAVILMTWFYWTNVVILAGAEFNSELIKAGKKRPLEIKRPDEAVKPKPQQRAA